MNVVAKLVATEAQLQQIVNYSAVGYHEELFVDVSGSSINVLGGDPSTSAGSYCDFDESFVQGIDGDTDAYFEVGRLMNFVNLVANAGSSDVAIELEFMQSASSDDDLAEKVRVTRADNDEFEATVVLPSGSIIYENIPAGLPDRFTADDRMLNASDDPLETEIETYVARMEQLLDASEIADMEYYPVTVSGGRFVVEVGERSNGQIQGVLGGEVTGPDVSNRYGAHFEEVVKQFDGEVLLATEEDMPLLFLQDGGSYTIRHVMGAAV